MIVSSYSAQETFTIGQKLGKQLLPGSIVSFFGDLAAGKTTFIKGLASSAIGINSAEISSPTFVLLNIYEGSRTFYHFDLYRLKDSTDFYNMGFDDYLNSSGISCIEWAERIEDILPSDSIKIRISSTGENERVISLEGMKDSF